MTPPTARMRPGPRRKFTVALHSTVRHGARRAQRWRIVVHMGRTRLAAAMAALVVALSGCAAGAPANSGTPTPIDSRLPRRRSPEVPSAMRPTPSSAPSSPSRSAAPGRRRLRRHRHPQGRRHGAGHHSVDPRPRVPRAEPSRSTCSLLSTLRLVDATETPAGGLGHGWRVGSRGRRRDDQRRDRHRHHRPCSAAARPERPIARGGGWPGRVARGRRDAVHPCRDRVHDPDQHGLQLTAVARRHLRAPVPNWRASARPRPIRPRSPSGEREFARRRGAGPPRARRVCPRRPRRRPRPGPRSSAPPPRAPHADPRGPAHHRDESVAQRLGGPGTAEPVRAGGRPRDRNAVVHRGHQSRHVLTGQKRRSPASTTTTSVRWYRAQRHTPTWW